MWPAQLYQMLIPHIPNSDMNTVIIFNDLEEHNIASTSSPSPYSSVILLKSNKQ